MPSNTGFLIRRSLLIGVFLPLMKYMSRRRLTLIFLRLFLHVLLIDVHLNLLVGLIWGGSLMTVSLRCTRIFIHVTLFLSRGTTLPSDLTMGSLPIFISSSSPSRTIHPPSSKGKEPISAVTPANSPSSSPVNLFDSDIDLLLCHKSLELEPLTIHKPYGRASPTISPASAKNITVRKKSRGGSRHFRGRSHIPECGVRNLSLVDVPIYDMSSPQSQPLRADAAGQSNK